MDMSEEQRTWPRVPIGSVYDRLYDGPHATPRPSDSGPIFLGIGNITEDGHLDLSTVRHIDDEDFPRWTKRVEPRAGDIVFVYEAALHRYAIIPTGFRGCLGRRLALIRPDPKKAEGRFLFYYFFGHDWRRTVAKHMLSGATVDRIPLTDFPTFDVGLPPLPTQRKIAAILSAYDDLIENNTRRIAILEEMARLLYREWFVEFRFPGHEHLETVDSQIGPIPAGWSCAPYADLLESASGGDWGTEEPTEKDKCAVTVIRGADFDDVRLGNELRAPKRYISCQSLERRRLRSGDILVENSVNASSRCVGKSLLITEGALRRMGDEAICASFCKAFRLKNPRLAPLIYLHLRYLYEEGRMAFYQHVATNGIGNFQATRFIESERVSLPRDAELLCQFTSHLANFTSSVYADRASNLRRTRNLLLPNLVCGALGVQDLDIEVGDLSA